MSGQCRPDRELRRLRIARFADQQDVGILPEQRTQRLRERETNLLADLRLPDPREFIFDRILERVNHARSVIQCVQRGVERRGFA